MHVWVLLCPPELQREPWRVAVESRLMGSDMVLAGVSRESHRRYTSVVTGVLSDVQQPRLSVLDLAEPFFDDRGQSVVGSPSVSWFADRHHLSVEGVRKFVVPTLKALVGRLRCGEGRQEGSLSEGD